MDNRIYYFQSKPFDNPTYFATISIPPEDTQIPSLDYKQKTIDMSDKYIFTKEDCEVLAFCVSHSFKDLILKYDYQKIEQIRALLIKLMEITEGVYNVMEDESV